MAERGRVVPELDEATGQELVVGRARLISEIGNEAVYVLA